MYYKIIRSNELYHHGILGQKWGVRNGPPYPLDESDKSSSERLSERFHLTDKQKKILKIGAAVAVTGLAIYGATKLAPAITNKAYKTSLKNSPINLDKGIDFGAGDNGKTKGLSISQIDDAIKKVNPYFNTEIGARFNCGNSVLATELNLRGGNFEARLNEHGMTKSALLSFAKNYSSDNIIEDLRPDISSGNKTTAVRSAITASIASKFPDNSRGAIFLPMDIANHWFSWVKSDGKVIFADGQNASVKDSDFNDLFSHYKFYRNNNDLSLDIFRLDNVEFNDKIDSVVKDNSKLLNLSSHGFDSYILEGENFVMNMKMK